MATNKNKVRNGFLRGMLSLFYPVSIPKPISVEEMEKKVWWDVGNCLRSSMNAYEKTETYQAAISKKSHSL